MLDVSRAVAKTWWVCFLDYGGAYACCAAAFYGDRYSHANEVTSTGTKRRGEGTIPFVDCALLKRERRIVDTERQGAGHNEPNRCCGAHHPGERSWCRDSLESCT